MLTLYYAPDNASLILRLALEEAGLRYRTVLVDRAARAQKAPEYLALNPAGQIPTLVTPSGPIAQTGACLLWLCDAHPAAYLGPAPGSAKRGVFLQWLFFLSNTVHADLNRIFYPDRFVPSETVGAHHDTMAERLVGHLRILDDAVRADRETFAPPSALALYLAPLLRWAALYPVAGRRWLDLTAFPALACLAADVEMRAAARKAAEAEGLGETPFSAPRLPTPPEGSAT